MIYRRDYCILAAALLVMTVYLIVLALHKVGYSEMVLGNYNPSWFGLGENCTLDYINDYKLPQDHKCVIQIIREKFLINPARDGVPLNLTNPEVDDPSQYGNVVMRRMRNILRNKTDGFFVESGAHDGESLSNTLFMERFLRWTGILIEPNPQSFRHIPPKNRKVWAVPVCLSLQPYPTMSTFFLNDVYGHILEQNASQSDKRIVKIQCFPLYSILLAVGRTTVDFFSLDIEGHELPVLQTIPWEKVNIKSLLVEHGFKKERLVPLVSYMESKGYYLIENSVSDGMFIRGLID